MFMAAIRLAAAAMSAVSASGPFTGISADGCSLLPVSWGFELCLSPDGFGLFSGLSCFMLSGFAFALAALLFIMSLNSLFSAFFAAPFFAAALNARAIISTFFVFIFLTSFQWC